MKESDPQETTRQERREVKQRKKREKIPQHGKSLGKVYSEAVKKNIKSK
jgi:hypothetical protein